MKTRKVIIIILLILAFLFGGIVVFLYSNHLSEPEAVKEEETDVLEDEDIPETHESEKENDDMMQSTEDLVEEGNVVYESIEAKSFNFMYYLKKVAHYDLDSVEKIPNVGVIDNAQTAIEKAKDVWKETDPELMIDSEDILDFFVRYNEDEDWWFMYAMFRRPTLGSVPNIIIRPDGEVLAMWIS